MSSNNKFLFELVKESASSLEIEEAVRLLDSEELVKIAERPEADAAQQLVGGIMHKVHTLPLAAILGGVGVLHAALSDPERDPQTGEPKSKLENMLAEGIGGAMVGKGISHAGSIARGLHGPTGDYLRRAQLKAVRMEPNPTDRESSFKSVLKGRKSALKVGAEKKKIEAKMNGKKPSSKAKAPPAHSESEPNFDIDEQEPVSLSQYLGNLPPGKDKGASDTNALKTLADYLKSGAKSGSNYLDQVGPGGIALTMAAANAIRKGAFPDKDANGQDKDFLEEAVKGAVTGGLAGLALGHGIRQFKPAINEEKGWGEQASSVYKNIGSKLKEIFPEGVPSKE